MQLEAGTTLPETGTSFLVPKPAHDGGQLHKDRLGETILPQRGFALGRLEYARHSEAVCVYALDDDLHFNLPPLIYRLSSSEHSSEG